MQFKLVDIFNTKYFYVTTGKDLHYMLSTCVALRSDANHVHNVGNEALGRVYNAFKSGAPVEFDLAEARLTSDVTTMINMFARQGIVFVDTNAPWRNNILTENRKRLELEFSYKDAVQLPAFDSRLSAVDYIQSLSKDIVYRVPPNNLQVTIPLVTMIIIYRPSIQLIINDVASSLFKYVGDFFTEATLEEYNEFYISEPEGVSIWSKGTPLYIQRIRKKECTFSEALTVADIVPTVFGKERLNKDKTFRAIASDCNTRLNYIRSQQPVKLSDVL